MIPIAAASAANKEANNAVSFAVDLYGYFNALSDIKDIAGTDIATINQQLNNQLSTMAINFRKVGSSQVNAEASNGFSVKSQSLLAIQNDSQNEYEREQTQLRETAAAEIASIKAKEKAAKDKATSGIISGAAKILFT